MIPDNPIQVMAVAIAIGIFLEFAVPNAKRQPMAIPTLESKGE